MSGSAAEHAASRRAAAARTAAGRPDGGRAKTGRSVRARFGYVPTRRAALLVAITAPVWLLSGGAAGLVFAAAAAVLLIAVLVADAVLIPGTRHVAVTADTPETIGLGAEAEASVTLRSDWPLWVDMEVHDALSPALRRAGPAADPQRPWRVGAVRLAPHGRATLRYDLAGRTRGEHALGDIVLRARGPLGLMQRSLEYAPARRVTVAPSIAGVRRYRLLALQHRLREAGVRAIRRRGEGSTYASLREYVVGDDPRHVDWKASARRGKLITREYRVEQGQTILIAIDAGRMMTQLSAGVPRFEHALASATVLADIATRSGDNVGLLVFDDETRAYVPPAKGSLALQRIRDAMIPVTASLIEPDYAGAFRALAARHRKRSLIVLFTDVVDPRASRSLIAHTARSAARHLPLIVALRNDALVEAALPREAGEDALFESAAAEELLLEREEALARMRRAGASVLDVSPTVMTAAVVNRYLAIKARSSL